MESRETVRAAKVLLVAGGLLLIGIVVGFILAGGTNSSPVLQAKESVVSTGLESPFTAIADKTLPYGYVVDVMATVQRAGITNVGMITNPAPDKVREARTEGRR